MHKFDMTVIVYFFRSLFLFAVEEVVIFRFKITVMHIIEQYVNDRFNINSKP